MILDIGSNTWTKLESECVTPRSVGFGFAWHESLFIFGGEIKPSNAGHEGAGGILNDLVCVSANEEDPPLEIKLKAAVAPRSRGWAAGGCLGSVVVLFGGLTGSDECPERLDDVCTRELGS